MTDCRSFVVAAVLGTVISGCGDASRAAAPSPPPPVVKVETVVQGDVPISAEWVGSLVGYINAQIRARVAGHLMSQNYTEGAAVNAGDLLFQVDPRPYQAALDQAEANLQQAESQFSQARAQVSASQAQVEQALAKVAQDEAQVKKAEADQATAGSADRCSGGRLPPG
jgi:membrane fusion protein, multidrug efflux system